MTKTLCLAVIFLGSTTYGQSLKTSAPQPAQDRAQQLSPARREVWAAEESMHRYEQQGDTKRFLSLWGDNFVGWPDYEQLPVRKPEIEKTVVEDFQKPKTPGPSLPAPKPEAIGIFGDVAVTHYSGRKPIKHRPPFFELRTPGRRARRAGTSSAA